MWHFDRLPPDQKLVARTLYENGEIVALMTLYNQFKVSPDFLVPCCSLKKTLEWTTWAIHEGKI